MHVSVSELMASCGGNVASFTPCSSLPVAPPSVDATSAGSCAAPSSAAASSSSSSAGGVLGISSFQHFFDLLQQSGERLGLLDISDPVLDHFVPLAAVEAMVVGFERGIKETMRRSVAKPTHTGVALTPEQREARKKRMLEAALKRRAHILSKRAAAALSATAANAASFHPAPISVLSAGGMPFATPRFQLQTPIMSPNSASRGGGGRKRRILRMQGWEGFKDRRMRGRSLQRNSYERCWRIFRGKRRKRKQRLLLRKLRLLLVFLPLLLLHPFLLLMLPPLLPHSVSHSCIGSSLS